MACASVVGNVSNAGENSPDQMVLNGLASKRHSVPAPGRRRKLDAETRGMWVERGAEQDSARESTMPLLNRDWAVVSVMTKI